MKQRRVAPDKPTRTPITRARELDDTYGARDTEKVPLYPAVS